MNQYNLIDAKKMHLQYPETFQVPSQIELDKITQHSTVKLAVDSERFWVEVIKIDVIDEKKIFYGLVVNNLLLTDEHNINYFDTIEFNQDNIYSIY